MTQEEFQAIVMSERKTNGWQLMALNHDKGERFQFYDSLTDMLMALSSGRIDEAAFPKVVGEYVLNSNPDIKIASVTQVKTMGLVFGFKDTYVYASPVKVHVETLTELKLILELLLHAGILG